MTLHDRIEHFGFGNRRASESWGGGLQRFPNIKKEQIFFSLFSTLAENHRHLHVRWKEFATKIRANFPRFARIQEKWEKN